jgi:hypothetical protein
MAEDLSIGINVSSGGVTTSASGGGRKGNGNARGRVAGVTGKRKKNASSVAAKPMTSFFAKKP